MSETVRDRYGFEMRLEEMPQRFRELQGKIDVVARVAHDMARKVAELQEQVDVFRAKEAFYVKALRLRNWFVLLQS